MMPLSVYEQVKRALQDIVVPEIKALQVEIKRLNEKMDSGFRRLNEKMDSVRAELLSEIKRLDSRIDGLDRELKLAIEIRERISAIEAKLGL